MLTIQYLEASPALAQLDPEEVVIKLRLAVDRLPLTHLLLGGNVPVPIMEACRVEAERLGMRFLRWHSLLTLSREVHPNPQWQVVGPSGEPITGYRGLPEFTFYCPNHPAVLEMVLMQLEKLVFEGIYQGFFLDRVRFPSPSLNPVNDLACFCGHCQREAAEYGLDLMRVKASILHDASQKSGCLSLVRTLLTGMTDPEHPDQTELTSTFLNFRKKSLGDFLAMVSHTLKDAHLEIGLDCFSPNLIHLVG